MILIFASKNKGKAAEIAALLALDDYHVMTMDEAGIDIDVVEDGETFEENATKKAVEIMKASGCIALADDSGLEVDALNGRPGIYSARFLGEIPQAEKNLRILEMIKDAKNRSARFQCVLTAAFPDGSILTAKGTLEGEIAIKQAGEGGFGYDPIFYVPAYGMTLAQMTPEQKNKISHRARALTGLKKLLEEFIKPY